MPRKKKTELPEIHIVQSSNISGIGYHKPDGPMYVKFKSGDVYKYSTVTEKEAADLLEAPSIGKHFHEHIKSKHIGEKV